jgi:hypothetical protein
MSARLLLAFAAASTLACVEVKPEDPAAPSCNGPTPTVVFNGADVYDALSVQGGFVYVELPGSGVERCPSTGCDAPTGVALNPAFVSSALGSGVVAYTTQIASPTGGVTGEVRSVSFDGSGDQAVLSGAAYPAYIALSGSQVFWADDSFAIDDTPATINCLGCTTDGASTQWMAGLGGGTYGMIADATNVYVLADNPTLTSVILVACSVKTACFSEPRLVLGGLDRTITAQQLASDGTNVYAVRVSDSSVVRVDPAGHATTVVNAQTVSAIAVDAAAGNLYYGTSAGLVMRTALDGSGQATTIACGTTPVAALAIDDTSVYFITGASGSDVMKAAK